MSFCHLQVSPRLIWDDTPAGSTVQWTTLLLTVTSTSQVVAGLNPHVLTEAPQACAVEKT